MSNDVLILSECTIADKLRAILNTASEMRVRTNDSTLYGLAGYIESNAEEILIEMGEMTHD